MNYGNRKTILLVLCVILNNVVFSQKEQYGVVLYGQKQSFGMGGPIGIDYNAELIFNAESSTYTCKKDALEGGHVKKMEHFKNEDRGLFFIQKATTEQGLIYHVDRSTSLIKTRDIGFNYVKDSIPKIDWKISNETKEIGTIECTKATTSFRGRDYTAWFSFSIPLPYGPWKLQGLPGLILEAYDTNKEIYFYFKSIEYPSKKNLQIIVPDPKTNTDSERARPTIEREWISANDFKREMIKRHKEGIKRGRAFLEQAPPTVLGTTKKISMKSSYIEVFDKNL